MNFLLDAIKCKHPGLNSAIAMVKGDKEPTRKIHKFKYAEVYLTLWDPINKNHNNNRKRGAAKIFNTSGGGAQVSATGSKQGRGSTWVEFCYYKYDGFKTLYKEQSDELLKWCKS